MAVVKGSVQHKLEIRQYRPGEQSRARLMVVAMVTVAAAAGFGLGWLGSLDSLDSASKERDQLRQALNESETTISDLAQKVGILEKGGEVDRQAANQVRETIKVLKSQVAGLEEEVAFYKGIMVPGDKPAGLQIGKVSIQPLAESRQYRYAVTMTQIAERRRFVSGSMTLNVVGKEGEAARIMMLSELDSNVPAAGARFRFRYFQELKGIITLPEGFEPLGVEVVLQSAGKKPQRVEQTIDWPKGAS
ncbi:MAG: hypothetical protein CMI09_08670 [Oceanospirillaceae bacterium]|nr:hypothetical protein [Oceanospirillaceae bacterium]|tara:strand:+ start:358 stop:1098 length:741 start_codon:yes stop_codon:yes gene_type:complete